MQSLNVSLQLEVAPERACYRKLRLLSASSSDDGRTIEVGDSEERDTDHDSKGVKHLCEEKGNRKTHSAITRMYYSLQEAMA